jgi:hypothetical protein
MSDNNWISVDELCQKIKKIGNPWLSVSDILGNFGLPKQSGHVADLIVKNPDRFETKQTLGMPTRYRLKNPENFK